MTLYKAPEDLPNEGLIAVARICGMDTAIKLIEHLPGMTIRIPRRRILTGSENVAINTLKELWNKYASYSGLSKVMVLTEARKGKCRTRLKERNIDEWEEVFKIIAQTPFLIGQNSNGWKASFDWIIGNGNNAVKVLEGTYAGKKSSRQDIDYSKYR